MTELDELKVKFKEAHARHTESLAIVKRSVDSAISIGRDLTKAKKLTGDDHWPIWVSANLGFDLEIAAKYMEVFEFRHKIRRLSDLDLCLVAEWIENNLWNNT